MALPLTVVALMVLIGASTGLDTSKFLQQVNHLANDVLGFEQFQNYMDTEVSPSSRNTDNILDELSEDLAYKMRLHVDALALIRDTVRSEFQSFDRTQTFEDCCDCCDSDTSQAAFLKFHTRELDLNDACYTGQGRKGSGEKQFPTKPLMRTMRQNLLDTPNLKWQYYGGEDGILTLYPASLSCNPQYDPRFRPWYSYTAFPRPKDVVMVLDRSGSMAQYHGDRQLIDIAKDAASTVIDSLNPDDRFGVVFFSDYAATTEACYSTQLAHATTENKDTLQAYIDGSDAVGGTDYSRAFHKAFEMFQDSDVKPDFDARNRVRVILFLTDGKPNDNQYLDVIREENAMLNNSVTILTFGFGTGIGLGERSILETIAKQTNYSRSAGPVTVGRFVYVSNPNNLRYNMATFYDFFSNKNHNDEVTLSVPYLDAFGLGLITSICMPVHVSGTFRGVTCIDITISDLFSDATFFSQNSDSYAVVMDSLTRLVVHPLLPRPSDVYDHPVILRMLDIESQSQVRDVVENYILQGVAGNSTFFSRRVLARGDSQHDGVRTLLINSRYSWKPLGLANLVVCVVIGIDDQKSGAQTNSDLSRHFPYHRLDLTRPPNQCRYINRLAVTDTSTIKFSPFAFSSPDYYLETEETVDVIMDYQEYFTRTTDGPFQDGVKKAVKVSGALDGSISQAEGTWQSAVWRYLGLREGVFRLYPGAKLVKKYKRAVAQQDLITFSKPYVDAFGAGIVITLSKTIFESGSQHSSDDVAAGSVGMDFTLDLFNGLVSSHISECRTGRCFLIDNGGYVIAHPDFEGTKENEAHKIENLHISQKESGVAAILVDEGVMRKDGCINYNIRQVQTFWRIGHDSFVDDNGAFEMRRIDGTNIFIIHVTDDIVANSACRCSNTEGSETIPACLGSTCECPCYNRNVPYNKCTTKFDVGGEIGLFPPCTPPTPSVDLSAVEVEERDVIKQLDHCYPVETVCPQRDQQINCSATVGCIWCDECRVRIDTGCSGNSKQTGWFDAELLSLLVIPLVVFVVMGVCVHNRRRRRKPSAPETTVSYSTASGHGTNRNLSSSRDIAPPPSYVDAVGQTSRGITLPNDNWHLCSFRNTGEGELHSGTCMGSRDPRNGVILGLQGVHETSHEVS